MNFQVENQAVSSSRVYRLYTQGRGNYHLELFSKRKIFIFIIKQSDLQTITYLQLNYAGSESEKIYENSSIFILLNVVCLPTYIT